MDEWDNDYDEELETTRPRAEGVRILGAEEAAAAVNAQQAGGEPPLQEPLRFERRAAPEPTPADDELWPVDDDPNPSGGFEAAAPPNLPHWTEPPTGEVPAVLSGRFGESGAGVFDDPDGEDDLAAWSALSGGAPRWRDQHDQWDDSGYDDASVLADPEPPLGALDERRGALEFDDDDFDFDDNFDEPAPIPLRPVAAQATQATPSVSPRSARPRAPRPSRGPVGAGARRPAAASPRDMQSAVVLGAILGFAALFLFWLGPEPTMVLATLVVTVASAELYDVLRRAGYQPATLVGLAGTVGIMVAAYAKGETAVPLAIVLVLAASFLWYLVKVVNARPTVNVAATVMAFLWTGVLGSYAALILGID
ncbi:MAG: UbiA family prenyltransferase, partial [Acidimicrobiales bacterium]|nr:UbiA family prenyltransferase [Acidimicrobiales bacterium]